MPGTTPSIRADGNGDATLNDYNVWAVHFGNTGSGTVSSALAVDAFAPDPVRVSTSRLPLPTPLRGQSNRKRLLRSNSRRPPRTLTCSSSRT